MSDSSQSVSVGKVRKELDFDAIELRATNKRWPRNDEIGHLRGDNRDLLAEVRFLQKALEEEQKRTR